MKQKEARSTRSGSPLVRNLPVIESQKVIAGSLLRKTYAMQRGQGKRACNCNRLDPKRLGAVHTMAQGRYQSGRKASCKAALVSPNTAPCPTVAPLRAIRFPIMPSCQPPVIPSVLAVLIQLFSLFCRMRAGQVVSRCKEGQIQRTIPCHYDASVRQCSFQHRSRLSFALLLSVIVCKLSAMVGLRPRPTCFDMPRYSYTKIATKIQRCEQ